MTMLLWRCPLCRQNDGLQEERPWLRLRGLRCQGCGAAWQVERVIGEGYYLRLVAGPAPRLGQRAPVAAWYREMKAGLNLDPLPNDSLPLAEGEALYLQAANVDLIVNAESPLLVRWLAPEAPTRPPGRGEPRLAWRTLGRGHLYLTDERLVWRDRKAAYDFWWRRVNSVFWFLSNLGIMYGTVTYRFNMRHEHVLKWLTYAGEIARLVRERHGHVVTVSYY